MNIEIKKTETGYLAKFQLPDGGAMFAHSNAGFTDSDKKDASELAKILQLHGNMIFPMVAALTDGSLLRNKDATK